MLDPDWILSWRLRDAYNLTKNDFLALEKEFQDIGLIRLHESWLTEYKQEFEETFDYRVSEEADGIKEDKEWLERSQNEIEKLKASPKRKVIVVKSVPDALEIQNQWDGIPEDKLPAIVIDTSEKQINHKQYIKLLENQYKESLGIYEERKQFFYYRHNLCELIDGASKGITSNLRELEQKLFFLVLEANSKAHIDSDVLPRIAKVIYDEQYSVNKEKHPSFNAYFQLVPPEAYNAVHPDFNKKGEAKELEKKHLIFIRDVYDIPYLPDDPRFVVTGYGMECGQFDGDVFIRSEVSFIEQLITDSFLFKKEEVIRFLNRCGYSFVQGVKGMSKEFVRSVLSSAANQALSTVKTKSDSNQQLKYDAFISHASEDKESFVRPLAKALELCGFNIWYDEFTLEIGDSLRRSINRGLVDSRFGIVVLSKHFFEKNWPAYELDGLTAREMEGVKVILPVWHNVTKEDVMQYSPSLMDKLAANSKEGVEAVVQKLSRVLAKQ